ncbi:MAG: hypothetical protein HRF43_06985 [Phycisphaerae bacterium]
MPRMVFAAVAAILAAGQARADLMTYLARNDPSYSWQKAAEGQIDNVAYADLRMVSQTWRGIAWKHRLVIVRPTNVEKSALAVMVIAGGSWREGQELPRLDEKSREFQIARGVAVACRMPVAFLLHVPFQPMFDGKVEDQIISYTFDQYLKSGEEDWPLLFPMVKSAVRAMDTVQAYAEKEWQLKITDFVVCGGSKRGWTTWLTGAADPRVKSISPIVIDMLNLPVQMKHQVDTWGTYSEQIEDYTRIDLPNRMDTPEGRKLMEMVDPYSYRGKLTLPKLLIMGTNDRYWPLDALNVYWDDLEGEKYVLYVPNAGHGVNDFLRLTTDISALALKAAGKMKFPRQTWEFTPTDGGMKLTVKSDPKPQRVDVWTAAAPTRDFREARWKPQTIEPTEGVYAYTLPRPAKGYAAFFAEGYYEIQGRSLFLSTTLRILGAP